MGGQHSIYVPEELWAQLQSFCSKERDYKISSSAAICQAIREFLKKENVK